MTKSLNPRPVWDRQLDDGQQDTLALAEGLRCLTYEGDTLRLFLNYQVQAERNYRRAGFELAYMRVNLSRELA